MKITKQQLKQIIKEELDKALKLETPIKDIPGESFQTHVVKKLDALMVAVNNLSAKAPAKTPDEKARDLYGTESPG
jgi:uncharacterized protein YicC (UPF0701 family)